MNKTVSNLTMILISTLLLSACAQRILTQEPAYPGVEVGTAVPGVAGPPLDEITPEVSTPMPDTNTAGQKTITRDAHGQTITLAVGESFLLKLGEEYTWEITVSDQNVLSRVKNIAVVRGAQGVYEAHQVGIVTISASGDPLCRQSKPACGMPSIQMEFTIQVK